MQDQQYAQLQQIQSDKDEVNRQKFFDKLNMFQVKNDQKTKALQQFMSGKDLATLSRLDEEKYMVAMA